MPAWASFWAGEVSDVLGAMARDAKGARVLEAALTPSSPLLPKLRRRLVRAFKGMLAGLGPHHIGGWVCASVWRASLGDTETRDAFAKELLTIEDVLRSENFAVWKVCGLNQAKMHAAEWSARQEKASKTKRLFESIIKDANPEILKAAEHERRLKEEALAEEDAKVAMLKDPVIAGLLPADLPDPNDIGDEKPTKKRKQTRKRLLGTDTPEEASRPKKLKRKRKTVPSQAQPGPVPADISLEETLALISGKANTGSRKKRKLRKAAQQKLKLSQQPDSDSEV